MKTDKYVIVCPKDNQNIIKFIENEIEKTDEVILSLIPKFPTRQLEKIFYKVKNNFDYLIVLNNASDVYYIKGFINDLKNDKRPNGIIFKRPDDFKGEYGTDKIGQKLVMNDDSLCISLKIFRGFRDINPQTTFFDVSRILSSTYQSYGDPARFLVGYNDMVREKRLILDDKLSIDYYDKIELIKTEWEENIKKKKEEEMRLIRTIPNAVKKINKDGVVSIISKSNEQNINNKVYNGNWNNWML